MNEVLCECARLVRQNGRAALCLTGLAEHPQGKPAGGVYEASAIALDVSDIDRQELLPSGTQQTYKNRAGWAHDRLKRAGLSSCPRRGFWQLTSEGHVFAKSHPNILTDEDVEHLAGDFMEVVFERPLPLISQEFNSLSSRVVIKIQAVS